MSHPQSIYEPADQFAVRKYAEFQEQQRANQQWYAHLVEQQRQERQAAQQWADHLNLLERQREEQQWVRMG